MIGYLEVKKINFIGFYDTLKILFYTWLSARCKKFNKSLDAMALKNLERTSIGKEVPK